mmetsp:Transcript_4812/g.8253  ORF Transcript_4812/g.8253 Transcript_4812/m.8253 type:complete len:99 (+) Transcript_4812:362-658(+)
MLGPFGLQRMPEALLSDEDFKEMKNLKTNVYVHGEGFQNYHLMEYSNFSPKKILQFKGFDKPNVVDMAFGHFHEAYIDSNRKLYVCKKAKLPSVEVEG